MENIQPLQAIERGEKQEQETLCRLKEEGLVDLADVTTLESAGPEFIVVGFTVDGLRLLKESKLPLLTDQEKEIARCPGALWRRVTCGLHLSGEWLYRATLMRSAETAKSACP